MCACAICTKIRGIASAACANTSTTPCDALTRAQSLYTFELFPDDIVALNSHALARRGIEVLTVYDALNDNRNIESSLRSGHEAGMKVNAMMTYTLSPVHTDAYYVERTRELVALAADFISIKDPTGLLTPERGRTLFPAVVQAAGSIPLQMHSHCQSGLSPEVYEIAIKSGFRFGYTATRAVGERRVAACHRRHRRAGASARARYVNERRSARGSGELLPLGERAGGQAARRDRHLQRRSLRAPDSGRDDLESALAA